MTSCLEGPAGRRSRSSLSSVPWMSAQVYVLPLLEVASDFYSSAKSSINLPSGIVSSQACLSSVMLPNLTGFVRTVECGILVRGHANNSASHCRQCTMKRQNLEQYFDRRKATSYRPISNTAAIMCLLSAILRLANSKCVIRRALP